MQSSIIHANIHIKVNRSTMSRMCNRISLKPTSNSPVLHTLYMLKALLPFMSNLQKTKVRGREEQRHGAGNAHVRGMPKRLQEHKY